MTPEQALENYYDEQIEQEKDYYETLKLIKESEDIDNEYSNG